MQYTVFDFKDGGGVAMGMYNTDQVIINNVFFNWPTSLNSFGIIPMQEYPSKLVAQFIYCPVNRA